MKKKIVILLFYFTLIVIPFAMPITSCDGCDVFADLEGCVTDCSNQLGWFSNGCTEICCMKFNVSGIENACRFVSTINLLKSNGSYIHSDKNSSTGENNPVTLINQGGGIWLREITLNDCFDENTNSEQVFNEIFSNPGTFINFSLCEELASGCEFPNNYAIYSLMPTMNELQNASIDLQNGCITIYMNGKNKNLMMKCINCCSNVIN